ncbi:MAG TPA: DUF4336 domain-containing protein [Deltaproteobacteria bacterium]|nr:DUF4336 domain-containing protein [Deltaproteobacteria bacterium]
MLAEIDDGVWLADGPVVSFYGFPYPTRMAVVRLGEGLWVWSPVELTPGLAAEVAALGDVRWLVEPNKIHHLFLGPWLERFEGSVALAPPGLAPRRPDLTFAGELEDGVPGPWGPDIEHVVFGGSLVMDEVVFFHRPSSTCFVGDLIQRHDEQAMAGWRRELMRLDDLAGPGGSTPREWRATFVDRDQVRGALDRALAWEPQRLIIAHGACAEEGGAQVLHDNLAWIRRSWPV